MKTKKTFIPIVTLCAALFLTACTGKDAATTEKPQDSQTEASTEATGDSSTTLDDLYQQPAPLNQTRMLLQKTN